MKIAVDGTVFTKKPSGIGIYIQSILEVILENIDGVEIIILSNQAVHIKKSIERKVKIRIDSRYNYLKPIIWLKFVCFFSIRKQNVDFFISPMGFLPVLPSKVKSISVVHDLNYLLVPETMPFLHYYTHRLFLKNDTIKADFLITNSKGTRDKIKEYWGKEVNSVFNPPTHHLFDLYDHDEVKNKLKKMGINFPYLMTVGNIEPRKNLDSTVSVFLSLKKKGFLEKYKLLIVGSKGWKSNKLESIVEDNKNIISRLGYVDFEVLPILYAGAELFLFPSKYEGFGMPVREALCCGTKVITSNIPELVEASFNLARYISNDDLIEYEQAVLEELSNRYVPQLPHHNYTNKEKFINELSNFITYDIKD